MSKSSISTFELFQRFPDNEAARAYFEGQRWPEGPVCPACGERERIWKDARRPGFYRCNADLVMFTVRTGTIFERSKVPLHKWLYAMYLLVTARKGISSLQLHSQIGVTQKTAWFMLQRLREACGNDPTELTGISVLRGRGSIFDPPAIVILNAQMDIMNGAFEAIAARKKTEADKANGGGE